MSDNEKREFPRQTVVVAVMITPNGDCHPADVLDLSQGGARVGLCPGWTPVAGTVVRMYVRLDTRNEVAIHGRVTRVGVDHLGVQFAPEQDERIQTLLQAVEKT
jgi:hypothetical protein